MRHKWYLLRDQFDVLSARERGLIGAATLVILAMGFFLPLESSLATHTKLLREVDTVSGENQLSAQQMAVYQSSMTEDVNAPLQERLDNLQQQLADVDLSLDSHNVVPANVMPT
ncbi:MAG: MSHA biogenesis protein MshJ, partial [Shewanella sp.]|nr:MSHA biogenesis protein MshJ [Shewanella sp.]